MYHTNKINQASIEKNLKSTRFLSKDLQIADYVATLSPAFRRIAHIYFNFHNASHIKLKNETIALLAGCSHKTVTRATNKFHEDGFITKQQENKYAPNHYTLNERIKKGRFAFSHWMDSLSPKNQDLYISHGIRIDHKNKIIFSYKNVPQNRSSLILEDLFINPSPTARARERRKPVFKKTKDPGKGEIVNNFKKPWPPVAKPQEKTAPKRQGIYEIWKAPQELPIEEQQKQLKSDIEGLSYGIEVNKEQPYMILFATSWVERKKKELEQLEIRSNSEKQSISNRYSPNSMRSCNA